MATQLPIIFLQAVGRHRWRKHRRLARPPDGIRHQHPAGIPKPGSHSSIHLGHYEIGVDALESSWTQEPTGAGGVELPDLAKQPLQERVKALATADSDDPQLPSLEVRRVVSHRSLNLKWDGERLVCRNPQWSSW
jgi:hypothetical protein